MRPLDIEFALTDTRVYREELDRLLDDMRSDIALLEANGEHTGATMMAHNLRRIEDTLDKLKAPTALLEHAARTQAGLNPATAS